MSSNPEEDLRNQIRDEQFREQMKARAETDPEAKRWVEIDQSAQEQENGLSKYANEIDKRKHWSLEEVEIGLQQARDARDEFLGTEKRGLFGKEHDEKLAGLHNDVEEMEKLFAHQLRYASPERISDLEKSLEDKQQALGATVQDRQAIAMLPSEEAAQQQVKAPAMSLEERTMQALEAPMPISYQGKEYDTPVRGLIDYSNYARTSAEEAVYMKQLEADQLTLHQQLGRRPSDEEMQALQAHRDAENVDTAATRLDTAFQNRLAARRVDPEDSKDEGKQGQAEIPAPTTFAERKAAWTAARENEKRAAREEQSQVHLQVQDQRQRASMAM